MGKDLLVVLGEEGRTSTGGDEVATSLRCQAVAVWKADSLHNLLLCITVLWHEMYKWYVWAQLQ